MVQIQRLESFHVQRLFKPKNIGRNLYAHQRQIWKYIEKFIDGDKIDVCPGIIYPYSPSLKDLKQRVEDYLNERGIQVVWYFE